MCYQITTQAAQPAVKSNETLTLKLKGLENCKTEIFTYSDCPGFRSHFGHTAFSLHVAPVYSFVAASAKYIKFLLLH